jgi:hypothetical protein
MGGPKRGMILIPGVILLAALLGGVYGTRVTAQTSSDEAVQKSLQKRKSLKCCAPWRRTTRIP